MFGIWAKNYLIKFDFGERKMINITYQPMNEINKKSGIRLFYFWEENIYITKCFKWLDNGVKK